MTIITLTTGMKLLRSRAYETVYKQSIEALRQNETNPLPFFLLGVLASDTGNTVKALEFFAKATEHAPKNVRYQTYHANTLMALGDHNQAKARADIAATIGTNDALLSDMIGVIYSRTEHHNLAIPFFEQAVKKNPKWAKFHFNLGASAEFIGDFAKAKSAYTNTLSINPKFYLAWFSLVALEKQTSGNNHLEKLKTLFNELTVNGAVDTTDSHLLLGHTIAKTLEDLGEYEDSFDWLKKAKSTKRKQIQYNRQAMAKVFDAAKTTITLDMLDKHSDADKFSNAAPIFIVGLPRTGTTLVDRILSSHPRVHSAGELTVFSKLIKAASALPIDTQLDCDTFLKTNQINLSDIGKNYIATTQTLMQGADHLIDKMPFNFLYAGLIHRALPNARIIVLRRGAMDSCLSNYRQLFASHNNNHDYAFDLEDTAIFYNEFDGLMSHWRKNIPPNRFMEIAYEDIIHDQKNQTRKLLSFCELEWDESCMRFHENTSPTATASSVQVRQPLYSGSIGRWKKYGHKLDALRAELGKTAQ
ncbi:MAG: protein-tyrosine sulfotransferase [Robiginitomaculum sp.]|nr:MAG: protein-tyrosine sulfotransferase [Robiginitomaculum sp.]